MWTRFVGRSSSPIVMPPPWFSVIVLFTITVVGAADRGDGAAAGGGDLVLLDARADRVLEVDAVLASSGASSLWRMIAFFVPL